MNESRPGPALPQPDLLARIIECFRADLVGVVLFGSRAQGTAGPHSDWDLLLVMTPETALTRDLYRTWDDRIDRSVQAPVVEPHFMRLPPPRGGGSIWLEAALHGRVLWQRDPILTRRLADARERITSGRVRRGTLYGSPYWILEEADVQR